MSHQFRVSQPRVERAYPSSAEQYAARRRREFAEEYREFAARQAAPPTPDVRPLTAAELKQYEPPRPYAPKRGAR